MQVDTMLQSQLAHAKVLQDGQIFEWAALRLQQFQVLRVQSPGLLWVAVLG